MSLLIIVQGHDLAANFAGAMQRMFQERKRVDTLSRMLDKRDPLLKQVRGDTTMSNSLFSAACCGASNLRSLPAAGCLLQLTPRARFLPCVRSPTFPIFSIHRSHL